MKQIRFVYKDQRGIHYDKLAKIILPPPLPFQNQNGCDMRTIKDALTLLQQREIPRRLWNIENNQVKALFTISHFEMANNRGPFYTVFESDVIALTVSPDEDYIVVTKRDDVVVSTSIADAAAVTPETRITVVNNNAAKNASKNIPENHRATNNPTASGTASTSVFVTPQKTTVHQEATTSAIAQTMNTTMNDNASTPKTREKETTDEKEQQTSTFSKVPSTQVCSQKSPYTCAQQETATKRKASTIKDSTEKNTPSKKQKVASIPRPTPPRKRKKPKDPTKPKHPKSAFLFFTMKERALLKDKMSVQEAGRKFGKAWKNMSALEKAPYELMSHVEWTKYRKAMKDYQPSPTYQEDMRKYDAFKKKYDSRLQEYKQAMKVYELEKEEQEKNSMDESENGDSQDIQEGEAIQEKEDIQDCDVMDIDSSTNEQDSLQGIENENEKHVEQNENDQEDDTEDSSQIIVILDSDSDSDESVFVHCSPQAQRVPDMIYSTQLQAKDEKQNTDDSKTKESKEKELETEDSSMKAITCDEDKVEAQGKAANASSNSSNNDFCTNSNDKKQKQTVSSIVDKEKVSDLVIGQKYFIINKRNEETLVELREINTETNNVVVRMLGNKWSLTLRRDELLEYTKTRVDRYNDRVNQTKLETKRRKKINRSRYKSRRLKLVIGEKYFVPLSKNKTPTPVQLVSLDTANGTAEIKTLHNSESKEVKQSEILKYRPELQEKWQQSQVERGRGSSAANKDSSEKESSEKESSETSSEKESSPQSSPKRSKEKAKDSNSKTKTKPQIKEKKEENFLTEDVKQKLMHQLRKRARVNPKDIWPLLFGPRLNSDNIPEYQSKKCVVQEAEQRRIYYASNGDTVKSVAKYYGIDVNQILYNNSSREGFSKLSATTKLKKNDCIILPIVKGVHK